MFHFSLRIILNKNICNNVLIDSNKELNFELFLLIDYLISQLICYNSYKAETVGYIITILENVENTLKEKNLDQIRLEHNLLKYGKIISNIYTLISSQNFDETSHKSIEINKKFKENLIQILNEDILIKYLNYLFDPKFINNLQNYLLYFENIDIILHLKGSKIINDKNENIKKVLTSNPLATSLTIFNEISFPRTMNVFLNNFCELLKNIDNNFEQRANYLSILESYLIYQIIVKNNKKLFFDIMRSLLFNKEFINEKLVSWKK